MSNKKETNHISSSKKFKKNALISLISSLVILIAINLISSFVYFRIDLTKDKRHSLSESTIKLLDGLQDKVYIKVYLQGDNYPADYQQFAQKTREMLEEFRSHSKNIYFEFIDPIKGKTREEANNIFGEFYKKGLNPIPISKEDGTGYSTHYVVPGAMISYKTNEYPATLVVADPSGSNWLEYSIQELEYNIVASIRKLIRPHKAKVAFLEGHGELDNINTSWMSWQLQRFYNVERIILNGKINSLREIAVEDSVKQTLKPKGNKYDVLIVAQPTKPFNDFDKYIIDQHIMRGGKVLWLIDATTAATDSLYSTSESFVVARDLRLENMFFKYGIRINTNLVQDLSCQPLTLTVGYIGDKPQFKTVAFPYLLNVVNFSSHPIVRKMKEVKIDFASTIDTVGSSEFLYKTVLMTTSERTKLIPTPAIVTLNVARLKPNLEEFAFRYQPLAVLVEGKFKSAYDGILPAEFDTIKEFGFIKESPVTRQIFVSDGDVIRNFIDNKNQPYPTGYDKYIGKMYDNSEFILNCVNYLCSDEDLLQIRSKTLKIGSLNPVKIKKERTYYMVVNVVTPLVIILFTGLILIILRRLKYSRIKK